jgi:hypothetical protein
LVLAVPSASQAQTGCDYGGYGGYYGGAGYGGYRGSYDRGYTPSYGGGSYNRGYASGFGGGSYDRGYGPGYHGSYGRRPVIEHPTTSHWTPDRGFHTHGHIHVPHRRHYHSYPY